MIKKYILNLFFFALILKYSFGVTYSDNHNVLQIIETLQQDIKTLERAVYSESLKHKKIIICRKLV